MIDTAERALLETTVRQAIGNANERVAAAIDDALTGIGWVEMLAAEPREAVEIVFGALGGSNAASGALDDVVIAALGIAPRHDLAVVYPAFATWDAPGRVEEGNLRAVGLGSARAGRAGEALVVAGTGDAFLVPMSQVTLTPVHGIDPDMGFQRARVDAPMSSVAPAPVNAWEGAVAAARRAIALQTAGACRAMLDLARSHAVERVQFGRPIVRFQAVRHRLAETLVAVETLDAVAGASFDEPGAVTAALAKACAGRTAAAVTRHCQQVLAGIGFTTEHPFHRYLKRTMVLEPFFGSADDILCDLGRQVIAIRAVPTLIEL
jgi:Acyl-CoA dehydrogenase, C-terminal domain